MYSVTICNMTCLRFLSQTKNSSMISSYSSTVLRSRNSLSFMTQRSCRQALVCHTCQLNKRLEMLNKHSACHQAWCIHRACKIMWLTMVSTLLSCS